MKAFLHIHMEGILSAYGAPIIDNRGVLADFPGTSTMVGLLGNALGYDRSQGKKLNQLQRLLQYGVRVNNGGAVRRFTDFQTAKLGKNDKAWTTRGSPEGRDGGSGTYKGAHRRYRSYEPDISMSVLLGLKKDDIDHLEIEGLGQALQFPARPLFLGRKSCIPSSFLYQGVVFAEDLKNALEVAPWPLEVSINSETQIQAFWPQSCGWDKQDKLLTIHDLRDWQFGVHMGESRWVKGKVFLRADVAGEDE